MKHEPFIDFHGIASPLFARKHWGTHVDWTWLCKRGLGHNVLIKEHAKPKESTPLLAILALRASGCGVKQIVKRTGSNVATVCASIKQYGVVAQVVIPVGHAMASLWGREYVDQEINAHGACERAYEKAILKLYQRHRKYDRMKWYRANLDEARKRSREAAAVRYYALRHEPEFKLMRTLRNTTARIARVYHGVKPCRTIDALGCTKQQARAWLEAQFRDGMKWANHGTHWEIDHIRPLSSFDLSKRDDYLACCHYTNLQPLLKTENRRKSDTWQTSRYS